MRKIENAKKLEKKLKNPNTEFIINSVSRRDLFYLFGHDEEAVDDINALSDEQIQKVVDNLKIKSYRDELFLKLLEELINNEKDKKAKR